MVKTVKKKKISNLDFFFNGVYNFIIDHDPSADLVAQLAQEVYRTDLLQALVLNIQKFEFEVKYNKLRIRYIVLMGFFFYFSGKKGCSTDF